MASNENLLVSKENNLPSKDNHLVSREKGALIQALVKTPRPALRRQQRQQRQQQPQPRQQQLRRLELLPQMQEVLMNRVIVIRSSLSLSFKPTVPHYALLLPKPYKKTSIIIKMAIILPTGQWYAPSAVHSVILSYTLLYSALLCFTLLYSA